MNEEELKRVETSQPKPILNENSINIPEQVKQRFCKWIDQRDEYGYKKYGQSLHTFDGRNTENDMIMELLDFIQYQEKSRQELIVELLRLKQELTIVGFSAG